MLRCWLFGHKIKIEQIDTYILRWCSKCGKVHSLDKIMSGPRLVRLEWIEVKEPE